MGLTQTVPPVGYPVDLATVKQHLRVEHDNDDVYIDELIQAATDEAEIITNRQFLTATFSYTLDRFTPVIYVPKPPLIAVSSIQYVDTANDPQTLDSSVYTVVINEEVGRIVEADSQVWPCTNDVPAAVTITYTAGYGTACTDVPMSVRRAISIMVLEMYERRGDRSEIRLQELKAVESHLWSYRVGVFS